MNKEYLMQDIADMKTYRVVDADGIYDMLKDFSYDYMVGLVEDLYHASRGTSSKTYGVDFCSRVSELAKVCGKYNSIEDMSLRDACQKLENEYDIVIREMGKPVHAKDIEKDLTDLYKQKEDGGIITDSKGDKYRTIEEDDAIDLVDLVHQMLYGE